MTLRESLVVHDRRDLLDATDEKLKSIVTAARLKRIQQPGLNAHVQKLQQEFEDNT